MPGLGLLCSLQCVRIAPATHGSCLSARWPGQSWARLLHYMSSVLQALLTFMGQCAAAILEEATGSMAQGMAAVGLEIRLPAEVARLAVFMDSLEGFLGSQSASYLPQALRDMWALAV